MPRHENRQCPRCSTVFECKAGTVLICQCSTVELSTDEQTYIRNLYEACLCVTCLRSLKIEHAQLRKLGGG